MGGGVSGEGKGAEITPSQGHFEGYLVWRLEALGSMIKSVDIIVFKTNYTCST